jgi:NAD(P)-dependent dehydrogenase (short-subunit alcohol dehydrogenase family)
LRSTWRMGAQDPMENDKLPSSPAVLTWVQQHQTARAPRKLAPRSDVVCTAQLRQKGNVEFVTSIAGRARVAHEAVYAAAKSSVDAFAESLVRTRRDQGAGRRGASPGWSTPSSSSAADGRPALAATAWSGTRALPSVFGALAGPFGGKTNPLRSFSRGERSNCCVVARLARIRRGLLQPLMATQLLFALPMASASLQRWPPLRDWQATLGDNRRRGVRLDDRR